VSNHVIELAASEYLTIRFIRDHNTAHDTIMLVWPKGPTKIEPRELAPVATHRRHGAGDGAYAACGDQG
jgi:hypothetical protein